MEGENQAVDQDKKKGNCISFRIPVQWDTVKQLLARSRNLLFKFAY